MPTRTPVSRASLAALVVAAAAPVAVAQPTPNYLWNNFVSAGTQWGNAANWVPAGPPPSSVSQVLGFGSSPLQTIVGYTTSNNLGAFDLNSMVFTANSLVSGGVTVTNLTGAANTIQFNTNGTTLPGIYQLGTGRVTFTHADAGAFGVTLAGGAAGTTLQVLGAGTGDVYLTTGITQTGAGASGLLINQTGTRNFFTGSQVRLGGSNSTFTGGVTLTAGNLVLTNVTNANAANFGTAATIPVNSLGTGPLTVNGGSLQFDPTAFNAATGSSSGTFAVSNPVTLNSTLTLTGTNNNGVSGTVTNFVPVNAVVGVFTSPLSGAGGLTLAPTSGFTNAGNTVNTNINYGLTAANTFTGAVTVKPIGSTASTLFLGMPATVGGTGGTLATTSIGLFANSSLIVNNTGGVTAGRLNPAATVTLNRATLGIYGNATANTAEAINTLAVNGQGQVEVRTGSTTATTAALTIGTLARASATDTLSLAGTNLGSGTGAGEAIIGLLNDPGGAVGGGGGAGTPTRSVLPYLYTDSFTSIAVIGTTNTFAFSGVTANVPVVGLARYDAPTQRVVPLNPATEYAGTLATTGTAAPASNQRFASTAALPASFGVAGVNQPTTVNSLVLDTNVAAAPRVGVSVQGTGTLTVAGGAILSGANGGTAAPTFPSQLNLGGLAFGAAPGFIHTAAALTVNAPISGTGGVVKSAAGTLLLTGANTFTGGLTVNNGAVQFSSDSNLGAAGQPLVLNSGINAALLYQPSILFTPVATAGATVSRPITFGPAGTNVSVLPVNAALTLSGPIGGPGQLVKGGVGILNLTGTSTYTGNTTVTAGILTANSDAALGVGGGLSLANAATFQPTASFTMTRDVLFTNSGFLFTGGQNLTIAGNVTSNNIPLQYTLFKVGAGDLTLTAANTYAGNIQVGESTPTVRASAAAAAQTGGRLVLTGADGSLASGGSILNIAGGELVLDNTAVANGNRMGNGTLGMIGGNATLLGNAGTSINEQVGAISINNGNNQYGGRLTLVTPAGSGQSTTLTSTAAYSPQAAPNVGTLFVRGTNLGAASGDRTAVVFPTNPAATNGLIPSILVATTDTAADPTTFATTSTITNAAPNSNQFSLQPFTAYTPGGTLGAGAAANTYDVTGATTFTGASAANALRVGAGGSVDLGGGTLTLAAGNVLTTGGANGGIANGTLSYAAGVTARFSVAAGSDLTVGAAITGTTGGLNKLGGGALTLNGAVTTTGQVGVSAGTLRLGAAGVLPTTVQPFINAGATLDLNNTSTTLGGLIGWGDTTLGTGTLTLTTATTPILAYAGGFVGSGGLIKDGAAGQVLSGASPTFTGPVQVLNGTLTVNTDTALGTSATPIQLGAATGSNRALLTLGATVSSFPYNLTVPAGSTPAAAHTLTAGAGISTLSGNIVINNAAVSVTSGGITLATVGLQLSGASGTGGSSTTQTGTVSGAGGIYIQSGNWAFTGNNTYAGGTLLETNTTTALGVGRDSTPSGVGATVASGPFGTGPLLFSTGFGVNLRADGGPRTIANPINLSSTGGYFGVVGTNPLTLNGPFDLQGATVAQTVNVLNSAVTTIGGPVQNGTGGFTKNGPGTLVLANANTYTGATTVNAGVLQLGAGGGTGSLDASNPAVAVNTGAVLAFNRTGTARFGSVVSGDGRLTHDGPGVTTLTGPNTYTGGTTVTAGTLRVGGQAGTDSATGTGPVTVSSGGTFGGTGRAAGPITVNTGGTLAAGVGGSGTLATGGAVTFNSGSVFRIGLAAGTPAGNVAVNSGASGVPGTANTFVDAGANPYSFTAPRVVVDVTGVSFTDLAQYSFQVGRGNAVQAGVGPTPVAGATFTFVNNGVDVTGLFLNTAPTLTFDPGAAVNNVYLNFSPVPEPTTVLLAASAGLLAVRAGRRRLRG